MIANAFWCGKAYSINFNPTREGLDALRNELERISKIPVAHQMILYQGIAIPSLSAPFDVSGNDDVVSFILYDRRITNANLPSYKLEKSSEAYLGVLKDNEADYGLMEDVKMLDYEEKHPIVYTKESVSALELLEGRCTASIFYHPIRQSCFRYGDKLVCKWCGVNCRHGKVANFMGMKAGYFRCQCSEITQEGCCSCSRPLTQDVPRTPVRALAELIKETDSFDPYTFQQANNYATICSILMGFLKRNNDEVAQACALSLIPDGLTEKYPIKGLANRDVSAYSKADATVYGLLQWFRNEFFFYKDNPSCPTCGTRMCTRGPIIHPLIQKSLGYVFECPSCIPLSSVRVEGDYVPTSIIEAQSGYLDDGLELFAVFLGALMYEVRFVVTDTHYKWLEVYSETQKRWIHCDPALGLFDSPLSYELTWGPFFRTCIALGTNCEFFDVSRRYTRNYPGLVKERAKDGVGERLGLVLAKVHQYVRYFGENVELDNLEQINERQKDELRQLISCQYAYGEVIDKSQNRYLRLPGNNVLVDSEWLLSQKTSEPVLLYPNTKNDAKRIMTVGTAGILSNLNLIVLTPNARDCVGAVWTQLDSEKVLKNGFLTEFIFRIESPGADGFAFVVQGLGSNTIGKGGCQLGYGGLHHSLAVEFDNYLSADECNDPNPSHVGINTMYESPNTANHGAAGVAATSNELKFADEKLHKVTIAFAGKTIIVWLDSNLILSTTKCDLERILKGRDGCWVGFTGATGGLSQTQAIYNWTIKYFV